MSMSDLGIRMYCSKAELVQRPNDLMIELCTPTAATVVAAPIRNEWPLNCDGSMPALVRLSGGGLQSRTVGLGWYPRIPGTMCPL